MKQMVQMGAFITHKVGWRKGLKCADFLSKWGMAYEQMKLGRAPTIEEYADHVGVSRATGYRDLKIFREVWPDDKDPLRVWLWCRGKVRSTDADGRITELWEVKVP
jgi:hypothetical protein